MYTEEYRLTFISDRDGADAALAFARQTYRIYRKAVLASRRAERASREAVLAGRARRAVKLHFASLPEYRPSFIQSCATFRRYVGARGM